MLVSPMNPIDKEKTISPPKGTGLFMVPPWAEWYRCRESFINKWDTNFRLLYAGANNSIDFFYFSFNASSIDPPDSTQKRKQSVVDFVSRIETILNVQPTTYEDADKYFKVKLSNFWWNVNANPHQEYLVRLSLFTLFLRAATGVTTHGYNEKPILYDPQKDNLDDVISNNGYLNKTKEHVLKFLDGYTQIDTGGYYPSGIMGWKDGFVSKRFKLKQPQ